MANIPITGLPSSVKAPVNAVELVFGAGASSAGGGRRSVVLVMPKLAAGAAWEANTVYRVRNEQQAAQGAGRGSPLHRACRRFLMANKSCDLYAVPYAPSSGGGGAVQAAATVTFAFTDGANPTATGKCEGEICGEPISFGYNATDTATTLATKLKAAINAKEHLPVTADNAAGVVTVTAKIIGASQGDGTVGVIRCRFRVDAGTNVVVTNQADALGLGASTPGVDGTTTEATNLTNALAAIDASDFYYVGVSAWDATSLAAAKTWAASRSEPVPGLRCTVLSAYQGSVSAGATIAAGLNYERVKISHLFASEWDTAEMVAQRAAVEQKVRELDSAASLTNYAGADWMMPPPKRVADWPDFWDIDDAITGGLSPIAPAGELRTILVMDCTTRSKNATGTLDDGRALEGHRISAMDDFASTVVTRGSLTYQGFKLRDDERLPNGEVNPNQGIPPKTLTPARYKDFLKGIVGEFIDASKFQDADEWLASLVCSIDPANRSRIEVSASGRVVDHANQFTHRFAETNPA